MSRIAPLVDELVGIESADDIMQEVLVFYQKVVLLKQGTYMCSYINPKHLTLDMMNTHLWR